MSMKARNGFTLIEVLVLIAILGVIAVVIALNVGNFFGSQNETEPELIGGFDISTVDKIVVGRLAAVDIRHGPYAFMYFEGGLAVTVTRDSLEDYMGLADAFEEEFAYGIRGSDIVWRDEIG